MPSHRERLETCLANATPDRPPVALWRHFPVDDQSAERLAAATLNFQNSFDFDFVKVTPASSFCLKDWGVADKWNGATEGTRDYINRVIQSPDDWLKLPELDPNKGYMGEQLKCLKFLTAELGPHTPVIQTIFNPLSQAKNLIGKENLLVHLRLYPDALHSGLQKITNTTKRFIDAATETGIAGIFFAVQHAQYNLLSSTEFDEFGKDYDLQLLNPLDKLWFNLLHIHGTNIMFDTFLNYPIQVINWHDRETFPTLHQAKSIYNGVVCGGLQRERTIVLGSPEEIKEEAIEAIAQTDGQRFILGTGCVVPVTAPYGNILAVRKSIEE